MALRGHIQDFGLADLLQLVVQAGKSGVATLSDGVDEVRVAIRDGAVVGVECDRPIGSELASRLSAVGMMSGKELGTILKRLAESGRHVCEILVNDGFAPLEGVKQYATLQAIDILFEVFTWPSGDYAFEEKAVPLAPPWLDPIGTEYLLMHCVALLDEWPNVNTRIKSHSLRVRRTGKQPPRGELVDDLNLDNSEDVTVPSGALDMRHRAVLELCQPGVTVRSVLDRAPFTRFETLCALCALVDDEYIRLTG